MTLGKWDKTKKKSSFTRKLLLEICISFLKELLSSRHIEKEEGR